MPANTIYVGRPSRFGNPFYLLNEEGFPLLCQCLPNDGVDFPEQPDDLTWEDAEVLVVKLFRDRALDRLPDLTLLRGKNLACWCRLDQPCHADVLLEIANK